MDVVQHMQGIQRIIPFARIGKLAGIMKGASTPGVLEVPMADSSKTGLSVTSASHVQSVRNAASAEHQWLLKAKPCEICAL